MRPKKAEVKNALEKAKGLLKGKRTALELMQAARKEEQEIELKKQLVDICWLPKNR